MNVEFLGGRQIVLQRLDGLGPLLDAWRANRFDAIYLDGYHGGKAALISCEFPQVLFEIRKVK